MHNKSLIYEISFLCFYVEKNATFGSTVIVYFNELLPFRTYLISEHMVNRDEY